MTPVAFALFIIALGWPLLRRLKAVSPRVIAVLATASVALLSIGSGGWLVVWGFGGITHWVIANAARLQGLYMHAADLLEQRGFYAAELGSPSRSMCSGWCRFCVRSVAVCKECSASAS
jgi:AI-2 transport protein TqsA